MHHVMIQNRSPIVPTFEEQPFSTTPQDHLKVSLFLEIAYLLALLLHFLGGLEGFLKFLLAQEVNHSHLKCDLLAEGVLLETGPYQTPTWMHLKGPK